MATAVTQAVPYSIEIIQPKVPIVRDGSMELKVKATRKEGFTAPITVSMLYNPPGVGSPSAVTIPEGQTEVVMPLTANSGAEVRTWKIVAIGSATVGNGSVLVSSQLADLEISEPFVGLAYSAAAVEKGKETDVVITVTKNKDFDGAAKVELLGLPNEVTSVPGAINKETKELLFHVKTTGNSPAGKHKTLLSRITILAQGEPITHMIGGGELRVDEPLPPKANEPAAAAAPMPATHAADKPPEKRLTRLEQLRLDRQKAKEAAKQQAGASAPEPAKPAEEPATEAAPEAKPAG